MMPAAPKQTLETVRTITVHAHRQVCACVKQCLPPRGSVRARAGENMQCWAGCWVRGAACNDIFNNNSVLQAPWHAGDDEEVEIF